MVTQAIRQADRELDVFARFIAIAGLSIDPASIEKREPPEPDILCRSNTDELVAYELVEIIDNSFKAALSRQRHAQDVLESLHEQVPEADRAALDERFRNAEICVTFRPGATVNRIRHTASGLLAELLALPSGFQGEVSAFSSTRVRRIAHSIAVCRGRFAGPIFSVTCHNGFKNPLAASIQRKLTNPYESLHPIELMGYLDLASMVPSSIWKDATAQFIRGLTNMGPFRRIWIVDIRNRVIEIVHPAE